MSAPSSLSERGRELAPSAGASLVRSAAPFAVGLVIAALIQVAIPPLVGEFRAKIVLDIAINIVLAVSLNIVNGFTGQFSMGHAGFMAVGGYTAAAITYYTSLLVWGDVATHPGAGTVLFLAATLVGGIAAAAAGYVVGLPSLRLKGDYLAIVTLGFGEIVRVLVQLTPDVVSDAQDARAMPLPSLALHLGGALGFSGRDGIPNYTTLFWAYAFVVLTLVTAYRMKVSSWGRAFLSVRENEIAAEAMGVPTTQVKVRAFVVAAFFAGVAGSLYGHEIQQLNPANLGFLKSFDVIIMVVLGGMGSVSGAVLAAIILTILPEALRSVAEYRMIVYALSLIVMMIVRPKGLFGIREIWELGPFKGWFGERRATT